MRTLPSDPNDHREAAVSPGLDPGNCVFHDHRPLRRNTELLGRLQEDARGWLPRELEAFAVPAIYARIEEIRKTVTSSTAAQFLLDETMPTLIPRALRAWINSTVRVVDLGALRLQPPEEDAVFLVPEPIDGFLLWAIRGIPIWEFDPA